MNDPFVLGDGECVIKKMSSWCLKKKAISNALKIVCCAPGLDPISKPRQGSALLCMCVCVLIYVNEAVTTKVTWS